MVSKRAVRRIVTMSFRKIHGFEFVLAIYQRGSLIRSDRVPGPQGVGVEGEFKEGERM